MKSNALIKSLQDPTIKLDELKVPDTYKTAGAERSQRAMEILSVVIPLIVIKEYTFTEAEIQMCELNNTGFIPTILLKIETSGTSMFTSQSFPTDGDLVSIFLRGRDDIFKPIRNDYLITNIEMIKSNDNENISSKIIIEGKLFVPGLYDEKTQVIDDTSLNTLKTIATQLGLGFSTNVQSTSDKMKWLCPNISQEDFIKNITDCAWSNETSFFTSFIDIYYNLNFINVNSQFDDVTDALEGMSDNNILNYIKGDDENATKESIKKIFTNHPNYMQSAFYIKSYKPINRSSEIAKNFGYKYNLNFFEQNSLKNWAFPVEPLVTTGNGKSKVLLKGRPNETFYKTQQKINYIGTQYSLPEHNVHEHYYLAKAHNMMNLAEIEKTNLDMLANKMNLNFIRFEPVPILIVVQKDSARAAQIDDDYNTSPDETFTKKEIIDKMYTGTYVIKGFKITYRKLSMSESGSVKGIDLSPLTQSFLLTRREWPSATGK